MVVFGDAPLHQPPKRRKQSAGADYTTEIHQYQQEIERPLIDLSTIPLYPSLQDDARETLSTLTVSERKIATDDNRMFSVRIIPYRRLDNMIDGVVITLLDIRETRNLEPASLTALDDRG